MISQRRFLSEVLVPDLDQVEVDSVQEYAIAGVYGFGRGLFARGSIKGSDTSYKMLNKLHGGQLVLSRLKAFEGAIAIIPPEYDGWFLSPEFPTFRCVDGEIDAGYLAHICRWPMFWSMLANTSKGIGARRERVHPSALLGIELRLPLIQEQRVIAAHLDWIREAQRSAAVRLRGADADSFVGLLPRLIDAIVDDHARRIARISDLADFVSDTVHPGDDLGEATEFVGLQHVESHTGRCLGSDPIDTMKGRKFRFRPGDVVYGYLRPYLNKVWVADRHGLCSVDQYVLRPRAGVNGDLLAYALRGRRSLNAAVELTHSLQLPRLRSGLLGALEVGKVAETQQLTLVRRLDVLRDRVVSAAAARRHQDDLLRALIPAALNEAFSGLS